ncbi:MAG TPA: GGDEF domain-containing protein, partial [Candidatus Faecousia intestinavium]|nr:GGDEF domain-containing protein [Candidatus Faecousia intestinavium]
YGAIPAVVVCLMCVGNLFTEVFFWVTPDNVYYRASWVWITYVVTYCYLSYGAVLVFRYRNQTNKYLFMPVMLFLTPIFLCSIIQFCNYGLALIWVSTAFGLTSLYINLQNERVFLDTLTNLYNRSYLLHYMDYLTRKMQKGSHVLGIMLDVNDFKHINDTYGHQIGDQVLQTVGKVLQATVGEKGAVVRYGGDEFVVLLENAREPDGLTFRQQVNQKLETYNASGAAPCRISLSMGAAEFDNTMGMDLFFHVMDLKMYEDKRAFYQRAGNDRRRCRTGVEPGRTGEACETEQK